MYKRGLIWATLMIPVFIGVSLPVGSADENQLQGAKILEGHMASYSVHLTFFYGEHYVTAFENNLGKLYVVKKFEEVSQNIQIKNLWILRDHIIHDAAPLLRKNPLRDAVDLSVFTIKI
jgi:hypothetical protein